jgi:hypothetical protein
VNQTLKEVAFKCLNSESAVFLPESTLCQTLTEVFRVNTTLTKLSVSDIDFRGGVFSECFIALKEIKSLKMLILDSCHIDNTFLASLGQALESKDVALKEIGLSESVEEDRDSVEEGLLSLIQSLERMPNVQKVHLGPLPLNLMTKCGDGFFG